MSFLFRFLQPGVPYYPDWVALRRRRFIAWLAFAAWFPVTVLVALPLSLLLRLPGALVWAAAFAAVPVLAVRAWATAWPCPRCGRPFYRGAWVYWPFASSCLHCGLPEYAPDEQEA